MLVGHLPDRYVLSVFFDLDPCGELQTILEQLLIVDQLSNLLKDLFSSLVVGTQSFVRFSGEPSVSLCQAGPVRQRKALPTLLLGPCPDSPVGDA